MVDKPTYEKLNQRVKQLEKKAAIHKQVEKSLRKSEATLRSVFRAAPTGIGVVADRIIKQANERLCEMVGYSREELLEKSARIFYPTDEEFEFVGQEKYAQIRKQGTGTVETRWRRKDGKIIDVLLSSTPIDSSDLSIGVTFTALDITSRKQAEESLRESEALLKKSQEIAHIGSWRLDLKKNELYWSDEVYRIFGLAPQEFGATYEAFLQAVHPDDRDRVDQAYKNAIQNQQPYEITHRILRPDGSVRIVHEKSEDIVDESGKTILSIGMVHDITEHVQAEEALRESERLLNDVFNSIQDGISVLNKDLTIRSVNGVMKKWYAQNLPLEGKKCFLCYHDSDKPCDPCPTIRCLESGQTEREIVPGLPGSPIEWIELFSYPIKDQHTGEVTGVVEFVRDITDRIQAEEAQRELETKYSTLVENSKDSIIMISDGVLSFVNKASIELAGYAPEEMIGVNFLNFVATDYRELVAKRYVDRIEGKDVPSLYEIELLRKDGKTIPVELNAISIDFKEKPVDLVIIRDITERKQSEEVFRESEKRFRETVELLPSIVCEYDTNGRFTYVNTYGLATFGYTPTDLEQGLFVSDLFPASEIEKFKDRFGLLLKGGTPAPSEYRLQTRDGSTIYVIADSAPIYKDGKIVGVRSSVTPITERKQIEEALKISEQKYRELSDLLPQIIFETDKDGNITFANRIAFDLFGYTRDDFKEGVKALQMLIPEDRDRAKENIERNFRGEELGGNEYTALRKDGGTYPVLIYSSPIISEGEPVGLRGIMADLSETKKAEESLRESEKKYRTVLEANPDPVVVYDMEGEVVYLNPAFTRVFGWTLEERLGKKMDLFVPEKAWPETKMMIEKVLAGEKLTNIETSRYTKKGEIIPVSISGATYRDRDGKLLGSVINLRDISEKKKLEGQLQQAQKMEAMGTLAGGIAHDFNNLLMGIQGRTSLMLMDSDTSPSHFEHLKGIEDYVKSAADLTRQLLGFARGGKYEVKPTELNALIKNENRLFGRTRKEINVQEKFEKNLWTVEVDRRQIEQMLLNIYINAWQAMPGGGDLYIQTENIIIDEEYGKPYQVEPGNYVKISITDTGVGMNEATRQRVFDPFFTTKEMGRGTGLGLASAYGIIKNHHGFINVYSEKGEGTTFNIYLPASDKEAVKKKEIDEELFRGTETLLFVDDEEMIVDVGCGIIEKLGYKVLTAKSGKEAMEIYKKNSDRIDMVILDMIMPDMGGGETYDKLKEINPDIKVLLSSGYSINGQATEILERGCNGFIQKPFNITDLSKKIREILDEE